jgi:hypothetical protein
MQVYVVCYKFKCKNFAKKKSTGIGEKHPCSKRGVSFEFAVLAFLSKGKLKLYGMCGIFRPLCSTTSQGHIRKEQGHSESTN